MAYMDRIEGEDWVPADHLAVLRYRYMHEVAHLDDEDDDLDAARRALKEARDFGIIGAEERVRVETQLDLERQIGQV